MILFKQILIFLKNLTLDKLGHPIIYYYYYMRKHYYYYNIILIYRYSRLLLQLGWIRIIIDVLEGSGIDSVRGDLMIV